MLAKWAGSKGSGLVGRVVPAAVKAPIKKTVVRIAAKVAEGRE